MTKSDSDEFGSNESLESSTASTVLEEDQTLPTLGEVLVNHPRILKNCDVKKLIQESLRKGYIRQVEEIPESFHSTYFYPLILLKYKISKTFKAIKYQAE